MLFALEFQNYIYSEITTLPLRSRNRADEFDQGTVGSKCFYNGPVVSASDATGYEDPCLVYYDPHNKLSCALCKFNAIRIYATMWTRTDGYSIVDGVTIK